MHKNSQNQPVSSMSKVTTTTQSQFFHGSQPSTSKQADEQELGINKLYS